MISPTDYTWQIKRLKDRIETLEALVKQREKQLRDFKKKHSGRLMNKATKP